MCVYSGTSVFFITQKGPFFSPSDGKPKIQQEIVNIHNADNNILYPPLSLTGLLYFSMWISKNQKFIIRAILLQH